MLVDGGGLFGDFDIGQSVLAPYLWDHGIEKIDYIIPTHSDNDHMEGLLYVVKEMKTGYLWNHKLIPFPTNIAHLENLAHEKNIPIKQQRFLLNNPNLKIERFHPSREFALNYFKNKENNFSTVFKLTYGIVSFLFASDIEKEAEDYLVKKYGKELHSTILKAPHHGSKTSSTMAFLKAVNPDAAVFSVGMLNRYRHPSDQVIKRYKRSNIKIFRTDLNGAITISTDGLKYNIETFIEG
jgi:competence protein ComEC